MIKVYFLIILVGLITLSSAATCAQKSYSTSCQKCNFDANGKMDQDCYNGYQTSGKGCLFAAYPLESIAYAGGNCPAIDSCVDRVQTCKAIFSSGSDKIDCMTGDISNCFVQGDKCVALAVKDCSKPPPQQLEFDAPPPGWCDSVFFLFILPVMALFYNKI
ncbi:MAG: hypothetical protein ABH842_01905 [Candidatus Micrarchaeota archaeon]